jgi:hypothetical protein
MVDDRSVNCKKLKRKLENSFPIKATTKASIDYACLLFAGCMQPIKKQQFHLAATTEAND